MKLLIGELIRDDNTVNVTTRGVEVKLLKVEVIHLYFPPAGHVHSGQLFHHLTTSKLLPEACRSALQTLLHRKEQTVFLSSLI